jgi:predicted permease
MVALVGHAFWQTRMGGAPGAVGSTLTLDGMSLRVIGVLPEGFDGLTGGGEVWVPLSALREIEDPSFLEDAWNMYFNVAARLAPGASLESARAEVAAFGATLQERFPAPVGASRLSFGADVLTYREARTNPAARTSMLALFGAVLLVLLVATANLAGLLLARGAGRQHEAALRSSLGAGRTRLIRQYLTESLVLAVLGGLAGLAIAWVGVGVLGSWLAAAIGTTGLRGLEYLDPAELGIDWQVAGFAVLLTTAVGVGFGVLPAWQAARTDPNASLRGGRSSEGQRRWGLGSMGRSGLIVAQVALAVVLLVGATVMMRSMAELQGVDLGYDRGRMLTAIYALTPADEAAGVDLTTFHTDVLDRLRRIPGVEGATLGEVPMGGPTRRTLVMGSEGRPDITPAMHTWIRLQPVADGHLDVLGAELVEGRGIEATDERGTEPVVVLNELAAETLFPDGGAIGRRVQLSWPELGGDGATVVGIARSLQMTPPGSPRELQGFASIRQAPRLETGVMVRTSMDPTLLEPAVRAALAEVGPNIALTSVMSMADRVAAVTARPRVVTMLLGLFGAVSLVLVAAGLYGTIAFSVARRTRELGLRVSLGADRGAVLALVLRQGLGVTLLGIALGLVGSAWATRSLQGLVYGTEAMDPLTLAGASALLFGVAALAAWVPARRATAIDPMEALRAE